MNDRKQNQGREDNAASPVEDYGVGKGVAGREGQIADSESPERMKRAPEEPRTFDSNGGGGHQTADEQKMMRGENETDPNDLTGAAGDPAEGKRPGGSGWPA